MVLVHLLNGIILTSIKKKAKALSSRHVNTAMPVYKW